MKQKMSENSLKNLKMAKPENNFNNSEVARNAQKKSVEKRKENQAIMQVAKDKLNKLYSDGKTFQEKAIDLMADMILSKEIKPDDLVKLLTFLRDTAGQKPKDVVENVTPPIIEIKGIKI